MPRDRIVRRRARKPLKGLINLSGLFVRMQMGAVRTGARRMLKDNKTTVTNVIDCSSAAGRRGHVNGGATSQV